MKFLYFGDRHATFKQPGNRLDNFFETCKNKDLEIMEIARREKVSALLQPGDFFEEKDIKGENKFIQEMIERYSMFNPKTFIEEYISTGKADISALQNFIPMVCIAGNHDLIGENIDSLSSTTLGLLASMGQLNLVSKDKPMFFVTEDGLKVAITGTNYHINMDEPEYIDDYIVTEKLGDVHIHIVHGMLSDKDMGKLIKHTLIDNIKNTKADITLCGHNHIGFGILNIDDKYFVNIGSLTRYTGDIKEIKRTPSVALIDISKKGINIEEIPLKSAENGASVIDRSAIEANKKRKKVINDFKSEITSLKSSSKKLTITDFVEDVAKAKSISDDIKKDILDRITDKENENAKIKAVTSGAFIEQIILENFQSHEYTELNLSKGFNVLVGESRQGKSAIERSLYWVYENKPNGKNFIKRGADYAKVTIILSNGAIVSRMVEAKKTGKNIYEIIYPDGTCETGNTKILPTVQKLLGFSYFNIDKKLSLPINFYKQGDSWYLIGNSLSSTDKARVIGALNGTNVADAIIRDLDTENNRIENLNKYALDKISNIDKELDDLNYLDNLNQTIEQNEKLLKKYQELLERKEKITKLLMTYKESKEGLENIQKIILQLNNLDKIRLNIEQFKVNEKNYELVDKFYKERLESLNLLEQNKVISSKLKTVPEYLELLPRLKNKCNEHHILIEQSKRFKAFKNNDEYNKKILRNLQDLETINTNLSKAKALISLQEDIDNYFKNYQQINDKLKEITKTISSLNDLNIVTDKIEEFYLLNVQLEKTIETNTSLQKLKSEKDILAKKITEYEKDIKLKQTNFAQLLKDMQICPVCKTPLEDEQINHMVESEE